MTPVEQLEQNIEELESTKKFSLEQIESSRKRIESYQKKVAECDEMMSIYQDALSRLGVSK
ncbi:hypothetical protein ACQR3P_29215 [Rhodococcus sp. IEGM1300]